ncbi:MAG: terminase large subunit domain-containing protein [Solirubrobacteraceae bacterium]
MPARSTTSVRSRRSARVASWPPRWLTPVPAADLRRGDGARFVEFGAAYCRVTKDSIAAPAGELIVFRPWQRQLLRHVLARRPDGRYRHRQALIGVARKNGKSAIGSTLGLGGLLLGPNGGEVYSCAADKEQARIVFGTARRMVELDAELSAVLKLYRDAIEDPVSGSVYRVLSAEAFTKEGLNPHEVIFDEVHAQPTRELWDVMALAMGARREPLMVGITTAGVRTDSTGQDSLCFGLYQHGRRVAAGEVVDPAFFMAWWEPKDPEADHRDPATWLESNPGLDDIVSAEDLASAARRTPEAEFRTKRCNQWVSTAQAWLPAGAWDACEDPRPIPDGAEVVLGFDGSYNNDSTALVAVEVGEKPHLDVVECWERPATADDSWKVPIFEVEDAIRKACRRWRVREVPCDPARWARSIQVLELEGFPMVEYPQSPERMVPATQRFYEAVLNKTLSHSGDKRLARHVGNCVLKVNQRGAQVSKETKNSPRKIDLAVAAIVALARAAEPVQHKRKPKFAFG